VRKTLARVIGRGDSLEGDPGSARRRATEQREEIAAFDHARTIGRSPNSRESRTNSTNTSTRR
jgi:hypothetical protein